MTHTFTYVTLEIPQDAWDFIAAKMREAGYDHAFDRYSGAIDMHGLGLIRGAAGLPKIPVLENFDETKPIGYVAIDMSKLPQSANFTFSIGYKVDGLREGDQAPEDGAYELVSVSPVSDVSYVGYLEKHGRLPQAPEVDTVAMIKDLTSGFGESIVLSHESAPGQVLVECRGPWTRYMHTTFGGATLDEALKTAVEAKRAAGVNRG